MSTPKFTGRNVSIAELANAIGKSQQFIRVGLQKGILKFGYAYQVTSDHVFSYYCPDKLVWEQTGYFKPTGTTSSEEEMQYGYETA